MIRYFEKNYKISWILTIVIASLIFYFSSLSFQGGSGVNTGSNTIIYHFFAFFFFALFLNISLLRGKMNKWLMLYGIFIAVVYGVLDEVHQLFVPGRFFSLFDIVIDALGVIVSSYIYFLIIKKRKK